MAGGRPPFCREPELAALETVLSAKARNGMLVVVQGPSGTGRTALLEAASGLARSAGKNVIRVRFGDPAETADSFGFRTIAHAVREQLGPEAGLRLPQPDRALDQLIATQRQH